MQRMFEKYDLFKDVAYSLDGEIIIDFLKENQAKTELLPDVIFLDLNMPYFSGWEFLEQFDQLYSSFRKAISIYIASASIDRQDQLRVSEYPFVRSFISKPASKNVLTSIYIGHLPQSDFR